MLRAVQLVLVLAIATISQIEARPRERDRKTASTLLDKLKPNTNVGKLSTQRYYSYDEMIDYMEDLAQRYPARAAVRSIGESYEKRPIKAITITNGDGRANKKVILIESGIHAREWIAPAAALYLIEQLVENYAENQELLQDYDWVILPTVNPDGYTYSRTTNKWWRGTRKPTDFVDCSQNELGAFLGTNPNRNFDVDFRETGSDNTPCGSNYAGPYAFSEPETIALRDLMYELKDRGKMFISLHSRGDYILYPWAYFENAFPDNLQQLEDIGKAGANAIKKETGTSFLAERASQMYEVSGTSIDYAYQIGYPTAFAIELSPKKGMKEGFHPPESKIDSYVKEAWFGIRAMAKKLIEIY